jgi:hypothetical protein
MNANPIPNRPGAKVWVSVLLFVALVVYPLSMGPVYWAVSAATERSAYAFGILSIVYLPVVFSCSIFPDWLVEPYQLYLMCWYGLPVGPFILIDNSI